MDAAAVYRDLLASPDALAACLAAGDMAGFLDGLRRLPGRATANDAELLALLDAGARRDCGLPASALAGRWFPESYRAADRSLAWCLPDGPPTEPFLDDYLLRCRAGPPARCLLRPRTGLPAPGQSAIAPAGFILHLSRCGSTLVSGALSELDDAVVLSESPLLTAWVLATGHDPALQRDHLPGLLALQAACFGPGRRLVVKWNAWDLLAWRVLRQAFPEVPCLLLSRDPLEILASHEARAGRHMAGDPSLACLHPLFGRPAPEGDLPGQRIAVLGLLMEAMLDVAMLPGTLVLDYARLDDDGLQRALRHFGFEPGLGALARIAARRARHSKDPGTSFRPDGPRKQAWFDASARARITRALGPLHEKIASGSLSPRA